MVDYKDEQQLAHTFALNYECLNPADPTDALALACLVRAACFAPDEPIPRELLLATLELRSDRQLQLDALRRLQELGLLQPAADDTLILHRLPGTLVQQAVGQAAADGQASPLDTAREAVAKVVQAEAERLNQTGRPEPLLAWQPQLWALAEAAAARRSEAAAGLYNELGHHLWMLADYAGARAAYAQALTLDETLFGSDHPTVAIDANNLGSVLRDLGDLHGAQTALQRALAIDEARSGPDHFNVAIDANNLGMVLQDLGDLSGAQAAYARALAIDEAYFGPTHPQVARDLNNLGMVLQALGNLDEARAAYVRALAIDEAYFGLHHPKVAKYINNLGLLMQELGDLSGARAVFERALAIFEQGLGTEHPHTRRVRRNLVNLEQGI
jgi:tetratricopeptide (TPR) repeat protein